MLTDLFNIRPEPGIVMFRAGDVHGIRIQHESIATGNADVFSTYLTQAISDPRIPVFVNTQRLVDDFYVLRIKSFCPVKRVVKRLHN
jgi:hypothetical protein